MKIKRLKNKKKCRKLPSLKSERKFLALQPNLKREIVQQ
jgi:hypothetical protein